MGNRGCLHDSSGQITKQWARKAWVTCLLDYKGRQRQIMAPRQYTELFFLDEATALASGHRPCGTCQKARYNIFKQIWLNANRRYLGDGQTSIQAIDEYMHRERYASSGEQVDHISELADLPDGVFVVRQSRPATAYLYWEGKLFAWEADGYEQRKVTTSGESVYVLTPQSVVRALKEGFWPKVHSSVAEGRRRNERPETTDNEPVATADSVSVTAPNKKKSTSKHDEKQFCTSGLHRLKKTPAGKELFTYFSAILRVTGMDKGASFLLKVFLGNFSTHLQAGRIEKAAHGYRLTPIGIDYFADRYRSGNRQHVKEIDVQTMMRLILNGGTGWEPVDL